ncbi:MAG: starch synthase [Chromatiales bacterium 21-64-14]|nr:MAG: starch synthase [Chromatiales bacterium 21-64-14]HQU14753.1 glycogen synthase GlgA [Gammaproteobacteria bacterium]
MKILFAASEAHPLIKTGGLADVAGSLPGALRRLHQDVRLILPAYRAVLERLPDAAVISEFTVPGAPEPVRLRQATLAEDGVPVYLVDVPALFDRSGGPYLDPQGREWYDNALRFATFCHAVVEVARNQAGLSWAPDVVHCHDWQTGLIPPLLIRAPRRPATVFTIHNLAYQGVFTLDAFQYLGLPPEWWSIHALEFYGGFSFIKGGLVYSDRLTTVSPSYAREICTPQFGCGLEGVLQGRAEHLTGILNGVDYRTWDPSRDGLIPHRYSSRAMQGKQQNKVALQKQLGLTAAPRTPLLGHIGRMVEQKGIDLILDTLPALMAEDLQLVILGNGDPRFEKAFRTAAAHYPGQLAVHNGYDEALAHGIEAGCDLFLMPSRFEPCGLNQLYSLRYGTVPVVRRTGGLADTVVDADDKAMKTRRATGFVFEESSADALYAAVGRALDHYRKGTQWPELVRTGMQQDFSWKRSAQQYLTLYRGI